MENLKIGPTNIDGVFTCKKCKYIIQNHYFEDITTPSFCPFLLKKTRFEKIEKLNDSNCCT